MSIACSLSSYCNHLVNVISLLYAKVIKLRSFPGVFFLKVRILGKCGKSLNWYNHLNWTVSVEWPYLKMSIYWVIFDTALFQALITFKLKYKIPFNCKEYRLIVYLFYNQNFLATMSSLNLMSMQHFGIFNTPWPFLSKLFGD